MNKTMLIGNLTRDVELSTTNNGTSVARFSIAVNRKFKDINGDYVTDFFNCVAWRQAGETIAKYCKKGNKLYVSGELQNRSYDTQDGSKRYVTELIVDEFEFLTQKNNNETTTQKPNIAKQEVLEEVNDDDLPF